MPNTYACELVSNPNVPIFLRRVCTLVLFIMYSRCKKNHSQNIISNIFHQIRKHELVTSVGGLQCFDVNCL